MKAITMAEALEIVGDPEAADRGYVTEQTITDALRLAENCGDRTGRIGCPHAHWAEISPVYAELTASHSYRKDRNLSFLCKIADHIRGKKSPLHTQAGQLKPRVRK
jgi:hypothetical protein